VCHVCLSAGCLACCLAPLLPPWLPPPPRAVPEDWKQQKAVADRDLRVFVRHMDFDNIQLCEGVRLFVAEAYDPAHAPPSAPDPLLQGGAQHVKPPKPPR
jgi:hypothetical protein